MAMWNTDLRTKGFTVWCYGLPLHYVYNFYLLILLPSFWPCYWTYLHRSGCLEITIVEYPKLPCFALIICWARCSCCWKVWTMNDSHTGGTGTVPSAYYTYKLTLRCEWDSQCLSCVC